MSKNEKSLYGAVILGALIGVSLGIPMCYWIFSGVPLNTVAAPVTAATTMDSTVKPVTVVEIVVNTNNDLTVTTSGPAKLVVRHPSRAADVFSAVSMQYPVDQRELLALSTTLYCEAVGEPWIGLASVADTIRNRVRSSMFPATYYGVTTQHKQFSCVRDALVLTNNVKIRDDAEELKFRKIINLAARTITGDLPRITSDALFYHTVSVNPYWNKRYHRLGVIGHHVFYTTNRL